MELGIVCIDLKNFGLSEVVEVKKIRKCSNLVLVLKLSLALKLFSFIVYNRLLIIETNYNSYQRHWIRDYFLFPFTLPQKIFLMQCSLD